MKKDERDGKTNKIYVRKMFKKRDIKERNRRKERKCKMKKKRLGKSHAFILNAIVTPRLKGLFIDLHLP